MTQPIAGTFCPHCERAFITERAVFITNNAAAPAFFYNKKQWLAVMMARAHSYVHGGKYMSKHDFYSLDARTINEAATEKALQSYCIHANAPKQKKAAKKHRQAVALNGGYFGFLKAVATAVWADGLNSFEAASLLGIEPGTIRQVLHRLVVRADVLGFETRVLLKKKCASCEGRLPSAFVSLRSGRLLKRI